MLPLRALLGTHDGRAAEERGAGERVAGERVAGERVADARTEGEPRRAGDACGGFVELDRLLVDRVARRGLIAVRASGSAHAIAAHVRRRLESRGVEAVVVDGRAVDDPFRDAVARVADLAPRHHAREGAHEHGRGHEAGRGASEATRALSDPIAAAESLVRGLAARGGGPSRALVVVDTSRNAWGGAVGAELARLAPHADALVFWIAGTFSGVDLGADREPIEVGVTLEDDELDLWWSAAASEAAAVARRRRGALAAARLGRATTSLAGGDERDRCAGADRLGWSDRIDDAERWLEAALALPLDAEPAAPRLGDAAGRLLDALLLARRAWPLSRVGELLASAHAHHAVEAPPAVEAHRALEAAAAGCDDARMDPGLARAIDELRTHELVALDASGHVTTTARALPARPQAVRSRDLVTSVARALERAGGDPWTLLRAAELRAELGAIDAAERAAHAALGSLADAPLREDLWSRWIACLEAAPAAGRAARLVRSSELALRVGHVDIALRLARDAAASAPHDPSTLLAMGRALAARGDLVGAEVALERALGRAADAIGRAAALVELAEVRYGNGDLEGARRFADDAIAACDASEPSVDPRALVEGPVDDAAAQRSALRIGARNVLGKVLLARSAWSEAETHFASDAFEAACARDGMAELRAQTNRAIALLSSGRLEEARQMLLSVHDVGECRGELRAVTFALANLATLATLRHEYAEALSLSERAFHAYRRLGERVRLAPLATNLAELRLRLGLVDEAEHGLRFGMKACGRDLPAMRLAHFSFVSAQIQLARGKTQAAATELASALAGMKATDGSRTWGGPAGLLVSQCHRLAARIALEDGDVRRAERALEIARKEPPSAFARAEIAVLEAAVARASGGSSGELAARALELAREADDVELVVEAHALVAEAALADGDPARAAMAVRSARAVRHEVASSLPGALRASYLGRRHAPDLDRLEERVERAASEELDHDGALVPSRGRSDAPASRQPPRAAPPRAPGGPHLHTRIVGSDPKILALLHAIPRVAASEATVLVHGESGTGKELVAEAIHLASPRAAGPLVKVNCAALVESLLLSELFGHEKGAFTGAAARRRGRFEAAEGGTIFLDEIGDISPRTQVALLRVLQDRTFERVGGTTPVRADVRIVCATHRDLRAMVARGEFREDLYYRLRGVVLEVPSLRQRIGDLRSIADTLLARIAAERAEPAKRLSERAVVGLGAHPWPGNVRELDNALRAAALFADGDVIELEDFTGNVQGLQAIADGADASRGRSSIGDLLSGPPTLRDPPRGDPFRGDVPGASEPALDAEVVPSRRGAAAAPVHATEVAYVAVRGGVSLGDLKRRIERECIARALGESDGNITRAASLLGMKRPRLSQLVKQYGLNGHDAGANGGESGSEVGDAGAVDGDACDPEDV